MALTLRDPRDPFWVTDEDLAHLSRLADILPDAEVAYYVRPCDDAAQREIRRDLVQLVFDRKTHTKVERPFTPEEQTELARRVFCHVLVDWRGIVDPKTGQPVPCDDAAKRAFMSADQPRVLALFQVVNTLSSTSAASREASFRPVEGVGAVVD